MIDYTTLEDSVYTIIEAVLAPSPVIIARQPAPAPNADDAPYTTILLQNLTQLGREIIGNTNALGITEVKADYRLQIDFQSYGTGARNDIEKLRFSFNTPPIVEQFLAAGLALVGHPEVIDLPKVINADWEETAILTATFNLADNNDSDTSFIGTVSNIDGDINDCTGALVAEIDLTVTTP